MSKQVINLLLDYFIYYFIPWEHYPLAEVYSDDLGLTKGNLVHLASILYDGR